MEIKPLASAYNLRAAPRAPIWRILASKTKGCASHLPFVSHWSVGGADWSSLRMWNLFVEIGRVVEESKNVG